MKPQITIPQWLGLEPEIKMELKNIFNIPRSGTTHVVDNRVTSDGHTHPDLATITLEKLQVVLDSDSTDFFQLLGEMVDTIRIKKQKNTENVTLTEKVQENAKEEGPAGAGDAPKKRGPKKKIVSKGQTVPVTA